jgi:Ca-activated chloride channel family protein
MLRLQSLKCLPLIAATLCLSLTSPSLLPSANAQDNVDAEISGSEPAEATSDLPLLHTDVNLVLVPVTVTDENNQPVLGLEDKDFRLYEDKQPQEIKYFYRDDGPLSIGLILDFSGSMQPKIDALRESVRRFFNNANPNDEYFVVAVSTYPKVIANGVRSLHVIESRLSKEQPVGWTSLLDSVELTLDLMKKARYQRRAIVIISDGGENESRAKLPPVVREVEESNTDIYAVAIFDTQLLFMKPLEEKLGKRLLTRLTDATGGRTITVENSAIVPKVIADLSLQLRNEYVLGYRPPDGHRDGKRRKIKVRLAPPRDKGGFQASYKKGYVPPPD